MIKDRKPIFDTVRKIVGRGLTQPEVDMIDAAITLYDAEPHVHKLADPAAFFAGVREITKKLDQVQVDSIEAILKYGSTLAMSHVAYLLATGWHEARFKPQPEWGKGKGKPYAKAGRYGQPQYGRGLVQLTWDKNYEIADRKLGLQGRLLKNFDLALEPDLAAQILVRGSVEGWFTTKKLADYIKLDYGTFPQFKAARRVINGTDRDADIAELALRFQDALYEGKWA